jgi:hypothetical protein
LDGLPFVFYFVVERSLEMDLCSAVQQVELNLEYSSGYLESGD